MGANSIFNGVHQPITCAHVLTEFESRNIGQVLIKVPQDTDYRPTPVTVEGHTPAIASQQM